MFKYGVIPTEQVIETTCDSCKNCFFDLIKNFKNKEFRERIF